MTPLPPLAGPVSTMLPGPGRTRLLRAALGPLPAAREALLAWQAEAPRPARRLSDEGRLLAPLIAATLGEHLDEFDARLATYLRTALVREELRGAEYRRILASLLAACAGGDPPLLLIDGAALAETVYARPELRHSHGIAAMVPEKAGDRATALLSAAGFRVIGGREPSQGVVLRAVHSTGLPLTLREAPLSFPHFGRFSADLWDRAEERVLLDSPARVLSPADRLWQACARAATGVRRETLLWACDAAWIIAREPGLAWDVLVAHTCRTEVPLPLWVLLGYLADGLAIPVPKAVRERLAGDAARTDRVALELALTGAAWRPGPKLVPLIRAAGSWRERAFVARWRILPSSGTLQGSGRIRSRVELLPFLVARPFRLLLGKIRSRARLAHPRRMGFRPRSATDPTGEPRSSDSRASGG